MPTIVEETTDGNLQIVAININRSGFTGKRPPIYTKISLGTPVIAKHIAKISSIFFDFEIFCFFQFYQFSFYQKIDI